MEFGVGMPEEPAGKSLAGSSGFMYFVWLDGNVNFDVLI